MIGIIYFWRPGKKVHFVDVVSRTGCVGPSVRGKYKVKFAKFQQKNLKFLHRYFSRVGGPGRSFKVYLYTVVVFMNV